MMYNPKGRLRSLLYYRDVAWSFIRLNIEGTEIMRKDILIST
jgi:hypothetical protein